MGHRSRCLTLVAGDGANAPPLNRGAVLEAVLLVLLRRRLLRPRRARMWLVAEIGIAPLPQLSVLMRLEEEGNEHADSDNKRRAADPDECANKPAHEVNLCED